jgi:glycosyltransferase involved in cell wall biosynthesis
VHKVSIVTISFNQCKFLERAIESILTQDYPDLEYIVVDPGSTDGSRELIQNNKARIAKTILEPDKGPSDGLNKGFAAATGDIFGFLNSDDILYPGAVSAAARFFEKHPDVDVVSGHAKIIGPNDEVLRRSYSDRMSPRQYIYGGSILIQPSTFFRRSAFQKTHGFNLDNRVYWDGELFLEMACAGCKFALSNDIWSGFRLHDESITTSARLEERGRVVLERLFQQITGRKPTRWDRRLRSIYMAWKHLQNPRDAFERITKGPVFGRRLS